MKKTGADHSRAWAFLVALSTVVLLNSYRSLVGDASQHDEFDEDALSIAQSEAAFDLWHTLRMERYSTMIGDLSTTHTTGSPVTTTGADAAETTEEKKDKKKYQPENDEEDHHRVVDNHLPKEEDLSEKAKELLKSAGYKKGTNSFSRIKWMRACALVAQELGSVNDAVRKIYGLTDINSREFRRVRENIRTWKQQLEKGELDSSPKPCGRETKDNDKRRARGRIYLAHPGTSKQVVRLVAGSMEGPEVEGDDDHVSKRGAAHLQGVQR